MARPSPQARPLRRSRESLRLPATSCALQAHSRLKVAASFVGISFVCAPRIVMVSSNQGFNSSPGSTHRHGAEVAPPAQLRRVHPGRGGQRVPARRGVELRGGVPGQGASRVAGPVLRPLRPRCLSALSFADRQLAAAQGVAAALCPRAERVLGKVDGFVRFVQSLPARFDGLEALVAGVRGGVAAGLAPARRACRDGKVPATCSGTSDATRKREARRTEASKRYTRTCLWERKAWMLSAASLLRISSPGRWRVPTREMIISGQAATRLAKLRTGRRRMPGQRSRRPALTRANTR
ncbi:hypothetical protein BAE44_0007528 [Dichanthelium oligosanthes]|uniref:Uncharacterized protein n=1 Tax=Dichanthelium oligosanthes TaxID=888268 RepID=A0A1E5W215_9POAL|nr:hypothetical protein BAE44_0007528 [Dichanthelium oligosanthes]